MTDSRIVATATAIPDKLKDEIKKVLAYYNRISPDYNQIVFLELNGTYYKVRATLDEAGNLISYRKLTVEIMRSILTTAAKWRTITRVTRYEDRWIIKNGGKCPRDVAYFALYEMSPDDLLELDVFRIEGGKIDRGERRLCEE